MQPNSQPDNAFHCVVPIELSKAKLLFWFSTLQIEVLSMSRDEFSFFVPLHESHKIRNGKKYRLRYRGDDWDVECMGHESLDEQRHVVVVKRLRDRTRYGKVGSWWTQMLGSRHKADPIIVFSLAVGLVISFLMLPGWGEDLGTTRPLTEIVQHCYEVLQLALRS